MALDAEEQRSFYYVLQEALRILYVDDDPILREFAQVHLTTDTTTICTAEDGVDALETIEQAAPDLILLDLEMPRMDGFEVLRRLRNQGPFKHIPVIVVTGREDITAVDRAFQEGATSFVVKPLNWRLLSHQIRYIHRTHMDAVALAAAKADTAKALEDLCAAGSRFLSSALQSNSDLKAEAARYLAALEAAHSVSRC